MEPKKTSRTKKKTPLEVIRESKIRQFLERVASTEKEIEELETKRKALTLTNYVGLEVTHKNFGDGIVITQNGLYITVRFGSVEKRFLQPNAFIDGFLTTETTTIKENVELYQHIGDKIKAVKKEIESALKSIRILQKDKDTI